MDYNFFDYKYNITSYHGEHFGSIYQTIYLVSALVIAFVVALLLSKLKKETVLKCVGLIGVAMTALYLIKTIWESHFDVATGRGFNTFLLPFDTCSILMWAAIIGGFGKGWFADWARKWLCVFGFIGGFANALFLNAFKYYPFFSFGAFYSMIWHFVMIFLAWWLLLSGVVESKWQDIFKSFGFHLIFSVLPITINYAVRHMNWMLYDDAGGVPLIESLCKPYANTWAATAIMLTAYFVMGAAFVGLYMLLTLIVKSIKNSINNKRFQKA